MQFGIELVTLRSLSLIAGDYFSTEIHMNHLGIPGSLGLDTYDLNTLILPQKRLAGTGRQYTYSTQDLICGMGSLQAQPSESVNLPEIRESLALRLETNRLLDYRELPLLLELEIHYIRHGREHVSQVSLHHPDLKIDWPGRGIFVFNLTSICQDLFVNIA